MFLVPRPKTHTARGVKKWSSKEKALPSSPTTSKDPVVSLAGKKSQVFGVDPFLFYPRINTNLKNNFHELIRVNSLIIRVIRGLTLKLKP